MTVQFCIEEINRKIQRRREIMHHVERQTFHPVKVIRIDASKLGKIAGPEIVGKVYARGNASVVLDVGNIRRTDVEDFLEIRWRFLVLGVRKSFRLHAAVASDDFGPRPRYLALLLWIEREERLRGGDDILDRPRWYTVA